MRLERDGAVICEDCGVADSVWRRLVGLMGRRRLAAGEGLLIRPAASIHTCFMRFPIDAVFLDRNLEVVGVVSDLRPWRLAARRGAHAVLELPMREAKRRDIRPGDRLVPVAGGGR